MKFKLSYLFLPIYIFLFSFIASSNAYAANFSISGSVKDISGEGIANSQVKVNDQNNTSTLTDSNGNYLLSIPQGTYNIEADPPSGGTLGSAIAQNFTVNSDKILNFVLTSSGSVNISGHVFDSLGNPLPNQTVQLFQGSTSYANTTTDSAGEYSFQATLGSYHLRFVGQNENNTLNVPQKYEFVLPDNQYTESTVQDITVPTKKVSIHVLDSLGNAVSNIKLTTGIGGLITQQNLPIGGGITVTGYNAYYNDSLKTDSSGNAEMWLFSGSNQYTFTAIPPSESNFSQISVNNVISGDTNLTITLQQPVTISGHIFDSSGNPLPNQAVQLYKGTTSYANTTTDSAGGYNFQATAGTYHLRVVGQNNNNTLNVPQIYEFLLPDQQYTENNIQNITIPTNKVSIHVQDSLGNAVSNIKLTTGIGGLITQQNLSIGGGITVTGNNGYNNTSLATDSSGDAEMWLFPGSNQYTFTAIPPSESNFSQTSTNHSVSGNTSLTIILQQPVTISGHIFDSSGNPLPNQTVQLFQSSNNYANTTTDPTGEYSFQAISGTYHLRVVGQNENNTLNVPQIYEFVLPDHQYMQSTVQDITVPTKKVSIHVQDSLGNAVSNINLTTGIGSLITQENLPIGGGIIVTGNNGYNNATLTTDSSGNAEMWLFPGSNQYTFTAIPPSGSIYSTLILNNILVSDNQTELISLQYSHNPPTTTANLSPIPDSQGNYSDPTTVTLSATAATGYTIANIYYSIDNGSQQTYTSPFTVSGTGDHTITYWSIDNSGVQETHNSKTFTITTPTPQLTSLNPAKIWVGLKNSDDIGIKFDLKAEVYKNNTLISSGQLNSVPGGSNGFSHAKLNTIPFNTFSPIDFPSGSQLSLKLYARNACNGSGKNSGTARLWYNDTQANSKFTSTMASNTNDYFLLNNSILGTSTGTGPKKTSDISSGTKCSPFKSFGTWTITP